MAIDLKPPTPQDDPFGSCNVCKESYMRVDQQRGLPSHYGARGAARGPRTLALGLPLLCALAVASASCVADVESGAPNEGTVALFNPAVSPAVVATPTDLIRQGGALQVPVDPAEATVPALKAFNTYLRGLDGYPPDSTAATTFSAAIDKASLADGLFVYDATEQRVFAAAEFSASIVSDTPPTLSVASTQRWKGGHSYVIALLSYSDGGVVKGLKDASGKRVLPDQAFTFLRSKTPLVGYCADQSNPACVCASLSDALCHAIVDGVGDSSARLLEGARRSIAPGLDTILAQVSQTSPGRTRADVALAWSFTISRRPFAVFDIARGAAPFPSDLLLANPLAELKPGATTVKLPASPADTDLIKALKVGLNTLDGFSTTGSAQFPIDGTADITAASVSKLTTLFLNTTDPEQPTYTPAPLTVLLDKETNKRGFAGQVWLTPDRPLLGDQNRYVAILTTGIKDAQGLPLTPSPTTVLLTQGSPLIVDGKSAVSNVSLANATQLELLRANAIQPLLDGIAKIPGAPKPNQIAALSIFRTQSITTPLLGLSAVPTAANVSTDVTFDPPVRDPASLPGVGALIFGKLTTRQVLQDRGPLNPAATADATAKYNKTIPFILTLPKKAATPIAKVAIVQHGLGRWRGDALAISSALAAKGIAGIAIDVIYHGGRVVCVADTDCSAGATCARAQAADPAGQCSDGKYKTQAGQSPLPNGDIIPDSALPQRDFTNFGNLFAARDNFRQHVVDLSQVVRVLRAQGPTSLQGRLAADGNLAALDTTKLTYVGQSLGALLGTNFLAVHPDITTGVLNVGGAPIIGIFTDPKSVFSDQLKKFFESIGIQPDTASYYSTLDSIRWILDPGDPINLGRNLRKRPIVSPLTMQANAAKRVILQESGMDTVIPNEWTRRLGIELGLPLDANQHLMGIDGEGASPTNVSTFFANADHGALFNFTVPSLTAAIQNQAVTYLQSGLAGTPQVLPPPAN